VVRPSWPDFRLFVEASAASDSLLIGQLLYDEYM
jgi:hypothetical protein